MPGKNPYIHCPYIHCLLLLFLGAGPAATAQTDPLRFEHLPKGAGSCLMRDQKGFLWFVSVEGLIKYDGYAFKAYSYDPQDSTSIATNQMRTIWQDKTGAIWLGTEEGVCKFNPRTETFTRFTKNAANPYALNVVQAFNEDREGNVWAGTNELRRLDRETGRFGACDYAPRLGAVPGKNQAHQQYIPILYKDRAGTLWIGSRTGLHRMHLTPRGKGKPARVRFTHYRHEPGNPHSLGHNQVYGIFEDRRGVLWLGTNGGGLHAFDRRTGRFTRYRHDPNDPASISSDFVNGSDNVSTIGEDAEGNLWVGTTNGLNKLNPERTAFTRYRHDPNDPASLSHDYIYGLLIDPAAGMLWVSTRQGIDKADLHQKPFSLYRHHPADAHSLSSNQVNALLEDREGTLWVGTLGGGLNALDRRTGRFTHYRHHPGHLQGLCSNTVSALLEDRAGNLWVGNGEMLSRLDKQKGTFTHYPLHHPFLKGYSVPPIFALCQDKAGRLWVGTTNGVVCLEPATGRLTRYPYDPNQPDGLSDWWAVSLLEDRRGYLWIGAGSKGLNRLDPRTGKFTRYCHDPRRRGTLSANAVPSLYEDARGDLWLGTLDGGLCRFNPASEDFTVFTRQQGLPGNSVYAITEDDQGNLWLGTNNGLARFTPPAGRFTHYDTQDGLQGNLFTAAFTGACARGKDGTLYFGGAGGFNAFTPRHIRRDGRVPPVVITGFRLFDKLVPGLHEAATITLEHSQNFFSFEFAALSFLDPDKNRYAYRLEGVDADWVYSGNRHLASYTSLSPGQYTFRVKAANSDGVWNEEGARVTVSIKAPYWQQHWFRASLLLAAAAIGFTGYKARVKRMKVRNRQLEKLVRERTEALHRQSRQLETSLREAEAQRKRAEEANRIKTELTSITVHDLQNPLGGIQLYADLIGQAAGNPEKVIRLAATVKETSRNMSHLVANLLKRAKLESSFISLQKERIDVSLLLAGAVERNRPRAVRKGQPLHLEATSPCYAGVDVDLMNDVLENLLSNAVKFTPPGKRIWAGVAGRETTVMVWVRDEGPGICAGEMDKLFGPFQRLSATPTGGESSTGLGLAIVKRIVELHGGQVKAESAGAGQGTVFTVTLPAS
jgi:ligand-binding sensor domain-containing protein/signal transduction histidine kinase